jgi:uncharacterized protein
MFLSLIGVVVAFILIVVILRKPKIFSFSGKINEMKFGLSLILGALVLGLFSLDHLDIVEIPKAVVEGTIYSFQTHQIVTETIELAVLTTLIYILAKAMQETGSIQKLIESLQTFFSKGGTLGIIPAVYGLMPNPGGSILSAPMVDEEGDKYNLQSNQKNLLNIWFRHIWEPLYPVYPAMILICSAQFSNINIFMLSLIDIPVFIVALIIGIFLLKKFVKKQTKSEVKIVKNYSGLIFLLPPIVPLFFYIFLQFVGLSQTQSFLIGIIFSIILLYFLTKKHLNEYVRILKKSFTWRLVVAIFGIMIFRQMFETTGTNQAIASLIGTLAVSSIIIVILIPFLLGLLIGYNLGGIALSYFLVQPFFSATGIPLLGVTSIVFISALVGYLISPLHLCNVLSSEYLKTDPTRIYKWFIPAALLLLVVQISFVILVYSF